MPFPMRRYVLFLIFVAAAANAAEVTRVSRWEFRRGKVWHRAAARSLARDRICDIERIDTARTRSAPCHGVRSVIE
jgi:hypothetical protein